MTKRQSSRGWQKHLRQLRSAQRHQVSVEATVIEARLQAHLPESAWAEIERCWREMPDGEAYLPSQRRDFLVREANRLGRLDLVPVAAFDG